MLIICSFSQSVTIHLNPMTQRTWKLLRQRLEWRGLVGFALDRNKSRIEHIMSRLKRCYFLPSTAPRFAIVSLMEIQHKISEIGHLTGSICWITLKRFIVSLRYLNRRETAKSQLQINSKRHLKKVEIRQD